MVMKTLVLFLIFYFAFLFSYSQNLVPNGSFEDTLACPTFLSEISKAFPWFGATTGTPDYYNKCNVSGVGMPNNVMGYQQARTGEAYVGLYVLSTINFREYLEIRLMNSLKENNKYCIEFYVSLANTSHFAANSIGMYVSQDSIYNNNSSVLSYSPQISNFNDSIISDTLNWIKISGNYTASGGEKFIIIGNFNNDANTKIDTLTGNTYGAYYYIDDVSVTLCDSSDTTGIAENEHIASRFFVHPNPNNGNMQLDYKIPEQQQGVFEIYDLTGRKILRKLLNGEQNTITISDAILNEGIYFYKLTVNGKLVTWDKVVVIQ